MNDQDSQGGEDEARIKEAERLLKDAAQEGEIARVAAEHEREDLEAAERDLEALDHPRAITIIVDGTPHEVTRREKVTYVEVVTLAHPDYPDHPEISYSVTYDRGPHANPDGILAPDGSVKVKEGMAFRVNRTGQS